MCFENRHLGLRYDRSITSKSIKRHADWLMLRLKQRFGWHAELTILPYRGHGTPQALFVRGRVVENTGIIPASADDSRNRNLFNMYRRFTGNAVAAARVRARFGATTVEAVTNQAGYFEICIDPGSSFDPTVLWHEIELELFASGMGNERLARAVTYVLVPPADAQFAVISDIDDTVIETSATQILSMLRVVLLANAYTRLPFMGVAAFYRALQQGGDGERTNPIFYISSSPWNIYDLLVDFLDINGLPVDPLFLRDWSGTLGGLRIRQHFDHKHRLITSLLATYPNLPFVLIGDSGQEDPEIYRQIVHDYPGRIAAVYIRDVTKDRWAAVVAAFAEEVRDLGVDMLLVDDTLAAAEHAAERGFIRASSLPAVQVDKAHDEAAPGLLEHLHGSAGKLPEDTQRGGWCASSSPR